MKEKYFTFGFIGAFALVLIVLFILFMIFGGEDSIGGEWTAFWAAFIFLFLFFMIIVVSLFLRGLKRR